MIGGRSALLAATNVVDYGNWLGNYSDVSLLLRNGTPQLVPFDESPTPKTIAAVGDASVTTAVAKWNEGSGGSSLVFDGSGDYLSIASSLDFGFGTGNFTVEYWVKPSLTGDSNQVVIDARPSNTGTPWAIGHTTTGAVRYYDGATVRTGGTMTANGWNHVAWSRSANVNRIFLNGAEVSTYTALQDFQSSRGLTIGSNVLTTAERFNGYIDDLRITKGIARYETGTGANAGKMVFAGTNDLALPTTELPANITDDPSYNNVSLLLRNGTSGPLVPFDESPTEKTITAFGHASVTTAEFKYGDSSLAFDGNGDWLETNATTDFDFANNPFTIEAWVYAITLNHVDAPAIFSNMNNGTAGSISGYVFAVNGSTGQLFFNDVNSSSIPFTLASPAGAITTGQWYHVAICKAGIDTNQVKLFVNGQIVASGTRNANIPVAVSGLPGRVGAYRYSVVQRPWNGYIDDLRITKSVARYTKNFLPPPAELPTI